MRQDLCDAHCCVLSKRVRLAPVLDRVRSGVTGEGVDTGKRQTYGSLAGHRDELEADSGHLRACKDGERGLWGEVGWPQW